MKLPCSPGTPQCSEPIFTARQPVFDREQGVWGYELFFRHSADAGRAEFDDAGVASARVIADGYGLMRDSIPQDARIFVNIPVGLLQGAAVLALSPERCIAEIGQVREVTAELLDALRAMKDVGYMLALDDYAGQPHLAPLLEVVDLVKVDVLTVPPSDLFPLVGELKKLPLQLLAEKVESKKTYALCRNMGFALFQGFYFGKPELFAGRKVSSAQMVKLEILKELHSAYDVQRLADLIKQDVSLSYRLLRYVNSAAMGLRSSVRALDQALVVLGERMVRQWLMVVLLADLNPSPGAQEVSFWSVQRARFLYRMAEEGVLGTYGPETMFLIGLFSRLDYLLGKPMAELVTELPLDGFIKEAYCGKKNFVRDVLDFLSALEDARWDTSATSANWLGIPMRRAAELRNEAVLWTAAVLDDADDARPDGTN